MRIATIGLCCGLLLSALVTASPSSEILSATSVERAGLVADWFTQVDVGGRSQIVKLQLVVNEDETNRIYLIEYGGRVEQISQHDLDAFGKPYGIEGAEARANVRREVITAELAAQDRSNVEVRIRPVTLPQTRIYAADDHGGVSAIDAATGRLLWSTRIDNHRQIAAGMGASKKYVAVCSGSSVFCLDANSGKTLWQARCYSAPSADPAVGEDSVYVPLADGRVEVFELVDKGRFSKAMVSYGSSVAQPMLTENSISWATSSGFYNVAPLDGRGVKYRLDSGNRFVSGAAWSDGTFFICTQEGAVFAVDEIRGSILWEYSTGDRISSPPIVKSGGVFVISDEENMYKFNADSGLLAEFWSEPISGVREFVGMSKDRIYVLDSLQRLTAINPDTGVRIANVPSSPIRMVLPNTQTDRLYVGNRRGLLQSLREKGNEFPLFHADLAEEEMKEKATDVKQTKPAEKSDDPLEGDDPFGDAEDPFGDADDSSESDPFGDNSDSSGDSGDETDPFGDSGSGDEEDPFGDSGDDPAEDDPFGDAGGDDEDDPFSGG